MIIDWKAIAENIYKNLKVEILKLDTKPILGVILVWKSSPSLRYIKQKEKHANLVWFDFKLIVMDDDVSEKELLNQVELFNKDKNISWFMVQLPLPEHIKQENIINKIDSDKDVDWFTPENLWKIIIWDKSWFSPCTPAWVMDIFYDMNIDLKWKQVTVLWKSNIVWKPMVSLLMNAWATVISCNSKTKSISDFTLISDIIISATWIPWIIGLDDIKQRAIIIDVWFSVVDWEICWDIYYKGIEEPWKEISITPVPWWVWPLTVANLMKNTLKAYKLWKI